uniref:Uncharacterized protein n=1 Tax=viral metagenome TaxID=1070528 RepID=A0A6M3XL88_9ZZZZ
MSGWRSAIVCCHWCGRDTRKRCGFCDRCLGIKRGPRMQEDVRDYGPIEDDYSDESNADGIPELDELEDV